MGPTGREEEGPHWASAVWILAPLLISCLTPGHISLPGSLCLYQEDSGLRKIHTGLCPNDKKGHPVYLLLWGSVNGSTLGLFMPLSDPHKTYAWSGVERSCGVFHRARFKLSGKLGRFESTAVCRNFSLPSLFSPLLFLHSFSFSFQEKPCLLPSYP